MMETTITKKDLLIVFLIMIVYFIGLYIGLTSIDVEKENQKQCIENLEEKLNIYRQSYENFVLEDSLNQ